jgi:hypothetical protein
LQNIRVGNPKLDPSYTHSLELGYSVLLRKKNSFNFDLYYSQTNEIIQYISTLGALTEYVPTAGPDMAYVTSPQNVGTSRTVGATLIFRYKEIRKLTVTTTLNGSYSSIQGISGNVLYFNDLFAGSLSVSGSYELSYKIILGATGRLRSPVITAQGDRQNASTVNLSLRRNFFDKRLTITLSAYDIFNTYKVA